MTGPPSFTNVRDERRHRQERLAASFRILAKLGLNTGIGGHVTVRDPEHLDQFWVNPLMVPFSKVKVSDLLLVNHKGDIVQGDRPLNGAAFAIHSRIHAANPDLNAACHAHSPWGRPWSSTGRLIEPTSQDACAFYEGQSVIEDFTGVVMETDVGDQIAQGFCRPTEAAAGVTIAVHANHGHISAGNTVDEAVFWFIMFESMCQSQMRLEATGRPYNVLTHDVARRTNAQTGSRAAGWIGFQGLYAEILAEQPDFLD